METGRDYPAHCAVLFRRDLVDTDDPDHATAGEAAYRCLEDAFRSVAERMNPSLDVDTASRLCWAAMQGLVVLYPTMVGMTADQGRPLPDLAEESRVFTRLMLVGMLLVVLTRATSG